MFTAPLNTLCSRRAFIRLLGTPSTSISLHAAPRTSAERAAVRMANCKARRLNDYGSRSLPMKAGTLAEGMTVLPTGAKG